MSKEHLCKIRIRTDTGLVVWWVGSEAILYASTASTWLKCACKKCENDAFEYIISKEKSVLMRKCAKYFKLSLTQMPLFQTAILSVEGNTIYLVRCFYFTRSFYAAHFSCHSYVLSRSLFTCPKDIRCERVHITSTVQSTSILSTHFFFLHLAYE